MKIWQRHLFLHLAKTFLFSFLCIFFVYITVDLSVHGVKFFAKSSFREIALFYLQTLAALFELFCSLSFLLTALRVLFDLSSHREILALQMAGLSKQKLLLPFFLFAALLSCACYLNNESLLPYAQDVTAAFKGVHKENKTKQVPLYTIALEDGSTLVYQSFQEEKKELFDVFWVRSPKDIWHMKYLQTKPVVGRYVHHLVQTSEGLIVKSESYPEKTFPEISWDSHAMLDKHIPFESRPISTLVLQAFRNAQEKPSILSHLYYKLLTPLTPFLILFAISPTCMQFSRNRPFFFIAAGAIFGFIAMKVVLDGMLILGENQVLPAFLAIFAPLLLIFPFLIPSFIKMR